jgi:hypothetical protein
MMGLVENKVCTNVTAMVLAMRFSKGMNPLVEVLPKLDLALTINMKVYADKTGLSMFQQGCFSPLFRTVTDYERIHYLMKWRRVC